MATVVLVHGIAQEQSGADELERAWVPALAGGVRATRGPGADECADALLSGLDHRGDLDVRMAFYGDLFLDRHAQGADDSIAGLTGEQQAFADELATEWLTRAATRVGHPDQRQAAHLLAALTPTPLDQGLPRRTGGACIRMAARIPWLAVGGMSFAESFLRRSLRQVTQYLTDPEVRAQAHSRLDARITADTRVVVAHSLGSVVAYEYLAAHPDKRVDLLVTLGSPLGLRTIVYDRLSARGFPSSVDRWVNVVDRDDLVACEWDLDPVFGEGERRVTNVATLDNGARPHDARFYLSKAQTGGPVLESLHPVVTASGAAHGPPRRELRGR